MSKEAGQYGRPQARQVYKDKSCLLACQLGKHTQFKTPPCYCDAEHACMQPCTSAQTHVYKNGPCTSTRATHSPMRRTQAHMQQQPIAEEWPIQGA